MNRLRHWWQQHHRNKSRIAPPLWEHALGHAAVLHRLDRNQRLRLRQLAGHFMRIKTVGGAQGLYVNDEMRVFIAAQACLLILELDFGYFDGWHEVIVYPGSFLVAREEYDEAGVVHQYRHALNGEAWGRGPVILSWQDIRPGVQPHGPGSNVILHEFAHKLDLLNGAANGMPPLHSGMSRPAWTRALSTAYRDLCDKVDHGRHTDIDPYACESPAEFFAVFTENFFERPELLQEMYPAVYQQFALFYRQDPVRKAPQAAEGPGAA